jgi:hypothetical protein
MGEADRVNLHAQAWLGDKRGIFAADDEGGLMNMPPHMGLGLFLVLVSTKMALLTELGRRRPWTVNDDRLNRGAESYF